MSVSYSCQPPAPFAFQLECRRRALFRSTISVSVSPNRFQPSAVTPTTAATTAPAISPPAAAGRLVHSCRCSSCYWRAVTLSYAGHPLSASSSNAANDLFAGATSKRLGRGRNSLVELASQRVHDSTVIEHIPIVRVQGERILRGRRRRRAGCRFGLIHAQQSPRFCASLSLTARSWSPRRSPPIALRGIVAAPEFSQGVAEVGMRSGWFGARLIGVLISVGRPGVVALPEEHRAQVRVRAGCGLIRRPSRSLQAHRSARRRSAAPYRACETRARCRAAAQ